MAGGKTIEVSKRDSFKQELEKAGNNLVVVDFWASWCGPCMRIAPGYVKLSEDPAYANVVFLKVDVDNNDGVSDDAEITAMPTFQFYKNSAKIDEFKGASEDKLKEYLNKYK